MFLTTLDLLSEHEQIYVHKPNASLIKRIDGAYECNKMLVGLTCSFL